MCTIGQLIKRRWREFAWGVGTVSAVVIGSLPLLGIDAWRNYFDVATLLTSRSFLSVTAYQTQLSLIRHLFVYDPLVNPTPLFSLPAVGMLLPWVVFAVALGASAALAYRRRHSDLIFAAFAALSLILSPVSLDYHYTIALLPIALLLSKLQRRMLSWEGLLLIVGALLIAADLPYRSPKLADGAWALLAYPKLYGALLLWGLALTCSIHEPGSSMPSRGRQFET